MTVPDGHAFSEPTYTDGNALAGPLSEIFAVDVTAASSRCAHCSRTGPVGGLHVYDRAPGRVARCPGCGEVMIRMVHGNGEVWLDMSGTAALAIPLDDQ
ncbi:DUF6510 family protein [Streptomyces sp. NPDC002870]|uniref:DUF6510 family protein n=1 Tax=Streptomyces sp. NPDC002870 TaxID=3364666 RepID=UPI00368C731C